MFSSKRLFSTFFLPLPAARACAALTLLFILTAAAWGEPVKINGKKLDEVQDILQETVGTRNFLKHDLLRAVWYRPNYNSDSGSNLRLYPIRFDPSASPVEKSALTFYNAPPTDSEWSSGMHPAITTRPVDADNGYRLLLPDFSHHGHNRFYRTGVARMDEYGNFTVGDVRELATSVPAGNVYPTDAAAGLFVDGEGTESFVVARMTVAEGGNTHLGNKSTGYNFYLEFLDGRKLGDSAAGNPTGLSLELGSGVALFPTVRAAAGDFDNDGAASEVACIYSGSGNNYTFRIYKVARNADGSFGARLLFENICGARDSQGANIDGCDVAAGDFNGDGKTEVAALFNDLKGSDGHVTVQIFHRSGDSFATRWNTVRDNDHRTGGTHFSIYNKYYGLLADAGDLDGDGRDEIVYAAPLYGNIVHREGNVFLSVWKTDEDFNPTEKHMERTGKITYNRYALRDFSLAAAPLSGHLNSNGMSCADVLLVRATNEYIEESYDYGTIRTQLGDDVWLYKSKLSGTTFNGFLGSVTLAGGSEGYASGIMTANFARESMLLGEPTHMAVRKRKSYAAALQTPPYHVDYITAPWSESGTPALTNFSYVGSKVTYSKSDTESATSDISFEARQFAEKGFEVGGGYGMSVKKLAGFSVGGSGSLGWKSGYSKSLSIANNSAVSTAATISSATDTSDSLMFYEADFHIWRYPVLAPAPTGLFGAAIDGSISGTEDGTQYFSYTMSDEPTRVQGDAGQSSQFDDYNPIHEEGNLFSYPTTIETTPGYADKQADLSIATNSTLGGGDYTEELIFSRQVTNIASLKTTSKSKWNGSLSFNLGVPKILEGSLGFSGLIGKEIGDSASFTKSYQSSEKFQVDFISPVLGFNSDNVAYLMKMRGYADAAGVMNMAFAVDLASANAWLWRAQNGSVYSQKPDPSLVLPSRYGRYKDSSNGDEIIRWTANIDEISATQLRGIRFYDRNNLEWTTSSLEQGGSYTIAMPVYNASFVDAGNVTVEMGYVDGSGAKIPVGLEVAALGGWKQDTEDNKAVISFDWTVPADMAEGNYDLYFQIDPENAIDEIHEDWNTTSGDVNYDPGGNNKGRYPFAVTAAVSSSASAASLSPESFALTIDGVSFAEFRDSLAEKTEDYRAYGSVAFNGSRTLHNVYVEIRAREKSGATHERLVASRYIPAVFPGTSGNFSLYISPDELSGLYLTFSIRCDEGYISSENAKKEEDSGGSGGCNAGFGVAALALAVALLPRRRGR